MRLHDLQPTPGARRETTRKGRGLGSGLGKTAGRGHKGQKARSGGSIRRGFEGGQMPLYRRVPKRGFTNIFKKEIIAINVSDLEGFDAGSVVTLEDLILAGVIKAVKDGVKILGDGEITKALTVQAHYFSQGAEEKITAAGGKIEVI